MPPKDAAPDSLPKAPLRAKDRRASAPPTSDHAAKKPVGEKKTRKSRAKSIENPGPSGLAPNVIDSLRALIRDVPNFPKHGILFRDITTLLAVPRAFHIVVDSLAERFIGEHIDAVVGTEARGFIFGGALAARLNAGFVPARKPGKLPALVDRVPYQTEYSTAMLEMHQGSIREDARVLVVDDVLATGGAASAATELVRLQGGSVIACAFVIELSDMGGRERLMPMRTESVITY